MNLRPNRIRSVQKVAKKARKKAHKKVVILPPSYRAEDGRLIVVLPLPSREVSPNAQRGDSIGANMRKANAIRRHRGVARLTVLSAISRSPAMPGEFAGYCLHFYYPTARFRDDDNADASCKSYRDGIADALGVDDRTLRKMRLSVAAKDASCPRLEFILLPSNLILPQT